MVGMIVYVCVVCQGFVFLFVWVVCSWVNLNLSGRWEGTKATMFRRGGGLQGAVGM